MTKVDVRAGDVLLIRYSSTDWRVRIVLNISRDHVTVLVPDAHLEHFAVHEFKKEFMLDTYLLLREVAS